MMSNTASDPQKSNIQNAKLLGFEGSLTLLPRKKFKSILDVGAGGFNGEVTTKFLFPLSNNPIEAVEIVKEKADLLEQTYGEKIKVFNCDILDFAPKKKYDLISIDLHSNMFPKLFQTWLGSVFAPILRKGGYLVTSCFGFAPDAPSPDFKLSEAIRPEAHEFLNNFFGTSSLDFNSAKLGLEGNTPFQFIGIIGKSGSDNETVVYLVMQLKG